MAKLMSSSSLDSGWSWVVCFASFLVQFVVLGVQNSFGAFFIEFLKAFGESESATAWIGSIAFGLTFMNGPLATFLCARWGSRLVTCVGGSLSVIGLLMTSYANHFYLLYITYGLIWGLGASLAYFGSIAALTSYFKRHLSLAYGICLAGSGAGTPAMIVLLELLSKNYGWRTTFQSAAGVAALIFLCGLTYLSPGTVSQPPTKQGQSPVKHGKLLAREVIPPTKDALSSPKQGQLLLTMACRRCVCAMRNRARQLSGLFFDPVFWRDRAFVAWVAALGCVIFGYFIPFVFVIRIAKDLGVPDTQSTLLIAYLALTQTVFKVVFGRLGDIFRSKRIQILQGILLVQAVATTLCPLASTYGYPVLVVYAITFGFCDGCWSVMVGMGTELIVGKTMMPRAFGNLYGVIAIPLILGPPVSGFIFDKLGRYDVAFFLSGGATVVGICLMFVVQRLIQDEPHTRDEVVINANLEKMPQGDLKEKLITGQTADGGLAGLADLAGSRAASQLLVQLRGHHGNEASSRPCSLIISKLLEQEILEEQTSPDFVCDVWVLKDVESNASRRRLAKQDYPVLPVSLPVSPDAWSWRKHIQQQHTLASTDTDTEGSSIVYKSQALGSIDSLDSGRSVTSEETPSEHCDPRPAGLMRPHSDDSAYDGSSNEDIHDSEFQHDLTKTGVTGFTCHVVTCRSAYDGSSSEDIHDSVHDNLNKTGLTGFPCHVTYVRSLEKVKSEVIVGDVFSEIMENTLEAHSTLTGFDGSCMQLFNNERELGRELEAASETVV